MSVVAQNIYKSYSIAKFQGGVIILVCLITCVLNLWRRWWVIDFQVPERPFFVFCTNRAQSLYLVTVFPYSIHKFFLFAHFTSILQKPSRLSYNSCLHLSLFCRESRISVSSFWYHQSYDSNIKQDKLLVSKVSSKKIILETISPALQDWNVLHWKFKARRFNLQIILGFGKKLLHKTWL